MKARILATRYYLPKNAVTNQDIQRGHPSWPMDDVERKTGVVKRYFADPQETANDLAEKACRLLFEDTEISPATIDGLIVCTQSPDQPMPGNACLLQHRLGLPRSVIALDFAMACSGYVYGLYVAKSLVESGALTSVLVVAAETYSKLMHPDNRTTMTLFGDGAAVSLVGTGDRGLNAFVMGTDGGRARSAMIEAGGTRLPRSADTATPIQDVHGNVRSRDYIVMDGPAVLEALKMHVPDAITRLLKLSTASVADIDLFFFHQASLVAIEELSRRLSIPSARVFVNLREIGNTSSASLPIALRDAEVGGRLKPGMRVMLVGFGAGFSWGACLIDW